MGVPKVNVNVKSNIVLTNTTEFGTAAIIGESTWGEPSVVYSFSNYQDVVDAYQSGTIVTGAEKFFNNGGKTLSVLRLTNTGSPGTKATKNFLNGATPEIQIDAKYVGTYGNNITVTITADGSNRTVIITDGSITETYATLATNAAIVAAINAASELVTAIALAATIVDAISATALTTGANPTIANADYATALNGPMLLKDFDYLVTPGSTDNTLHASIASLMDSRATSENKYSIYIAGCAKFEAHATSIARTASNANGRFVLVHSSLYDGDGDISVTGNWVDASYTACAYAGLLCSLAINISPTNKPVGFTGGNTLAENLYTRAEKDALVNAGITVFDKLYGGNYGCVVGITKNGSTTSWNYVLDARRKVDFIIGEMVNVSNGFLGDPNDDFTRKAVRTGIVSVMVGARNDSIISTYNVDVLQGTDPREIDINATVVLVYEVQVVNINLTLTI